MNRRLSILFLIALAVSATLSAGESQHRTIVIRDGKVIEGSLLKRAYLGVALLDASPELREYFGASKEAGVIIQSVTENSPAAKAGLRVGDVITAIDGKTVDTAWDVTDALSDKKKGDSVRIELIRGHSKQAVVATADERDFMPTFKGLDMLRGLDLSAIERESKEHGLPGRWRALVDANSDCPDLQGRIKDLETRLQELEKKLKN